MNILFDIGHPAHVHLFKNFIYYLKENNHKILITTRSKDLCNTLLEHYNLDYISLTNPGKNLISMFKELCIRDYKIIKLHRKYNFNIAFGTSVSIGHLSFFSKVRSYNFCEDDDDIIPLQALISYPFSTNIIVPQIIRFNKWKKKRILHNSYHELAYLHPNNFTPDVSVLKKYNLMPYEFIIIRKSALKAHHDIGVKGIKRNIWDGIFSIVKKYPLVYSIENEKSHRIEPWDMHHIIPFAKMLISDSQTMTMEAAVLGVPSIRFSSFVRRISVLEELENVYGLTYGFIPGQEDNKSFEKIEELLNKRNLLKEWGEKRRKMLSKKADFNLWMIDFFKKNY